jgi:hypothetical protein
VTSQIVTTAIGLAFGVLTGFYFNKRSAKSTKVQNKELRRQLDALRATVYSLGGNPNSITSFRSIVNLPAEVEARARATQDASGRVDHRELISYFVGGGVAVADTEIAISQICSTGIARKEGRWLYMQ